MSDNARLIEQLREWADTDPLLDAAEKTLLRKAADALAATEEELTEWKLEAKRRGMPIENAKRLYAAEAECDRLAAELARARAALEIADCEASIAHDAIWHDDVKGVGGTGIDILHNSEREDSANAAIWRLHDAVRPVLAAVSGRQEGS